MANSSESPNTSIPIAHDLRKDLERRENKCILATCGIWRDFPSLGGKFVGTGSLVQGLFINFEEKIHLVTSNKVISSKDLSCYSLYFKKSRDREKEAKKLVKMVSEKMIFKSGLAIVPIDPEKLGIIRKYTSGLLKHRPFTIPTEVKKDLRNDKLYCHVIEESGKSFAISPYQVKGIADEETYVTDLNSIVIESASLCSSYRKGLGAPITIAVKDEAFAVGAITLGNNEQLSFVLFSQIDRTRAISDDELNIYVDVDGLKTGEQNVQTDMLATGSARRQEVQQPGVSAKSAKPKGVSHPQTEDVRIRQEHIFLSIIEDFLQSTKRKSIKDFQFLSEYAKEMKLIITDFSLGCLVITVKCESLMILEELWRDYLSGHLGKVVQNCFVTEMILKELNPAELRLKTIMDVEEYNACKMFFEKDAHRDALSSELYSTSSISESPQKKEQWEKSEQKTKIMETAKLEGTSPLTVVPTTDHGKELEEPWGRKDALSSELHSTSPTSESPQKKEQWEKGDQKAKIMETVKLEGASSSKFHSISSTSESLQNQEELEKWKQKTKIVETEKLKGMLPLLGSSTSDPEEEPEELRMKLQIMKGASSSEFHSISSPSESPQNQGELKKWKQKTKTDEKVVSSIVTTLFEATIGLLVNKGRDKAAEILKDGDVTDQKFHSLIVSEIDDIRSKLNASSRKDLAASILFFKEGIVFLYDVFDIVKSRNERGAATTQVARDDTFSLVEGITRLELTGLDESATRKLSSAKKRFERARTLATFVFENEGLETSDRILAMKYRVMATILETVDNPADALAPCRVCVDELNRLSAVQNSFDVQLKTGIQKVRGLFGKEERRKIIFNVCHVNRVIFDITLALGRLELSPSVNIGENKVIPLCDARVKDFLLRHGKDYCCVPPKPFGQGGKEEHKLKHKTPAQNLL